MLSITTKTVEKALPKIETVSENTPVVEKKHELPKTSSESSNTATTAVALGVVGLGAAMSLRRRKQHR